MRRLRQEVPVGQGAVGRLALALALSAVAHAGLLAMAMPRFPQGRAAGPLVLHARLAPVPSETSSIRAAVPTRAPGVIAASSSPGVDLPADDPPPGAPSDSAPIDAAPPAPAPIAAIPDTTYYDAQDLDVYPRPVDAVRTGFPAEARTNGVSGYVTLLVLIDEAGRVTEVSVVDAQPESVFDDTARKAFVAAAFTPAERAGKPARSRILVKVDFDPDKP